MDLELVELGNGGVLVKKAKDLSVIYGFQNMPYLALFGGNVAASTPKRRIKNEQNFDYWGNSILMTNDPSIQFNSFTERKLKEVALNSAGRLQIEQEVKRDLEFMRPFATIEVAVSIVSTDKVRISIFLREPDNQEEKEFVFIWDAIKGELIEKVYGGGKVISPGGGIFDDTFDDSFE